MSATDTYAMTPSRWGVPLKVLTNKKAADVAFQNHVWEMQKKAQDAASGATQQHIAGQYRLKEQGMQNQVLRKSGIEATTLAQAVQIAKNQGIDVETPEGQQSLGQIYRYLMKLQSGGGMDLGASDLAAGGAGPVAAPSEAGSFQLPGFLGDWQKKATGSRGLTKVGTPGAKTAPSSAAKEITATNPTTGAKMAYRNGSWQPL
jgi:hypothetical protein